MPSNQKNVSRRNFLAQGIGVAVGVSVGVGVAVGVAVSVASSPTPGS